MVSNGTARAALPDIGFNKDLCASAYRTSNDFELSSRLAPPDQMSGRLKERCSQALKITPLR